MRTTATTKSIASCFLLVANYVFCLPSLAAGTPPATVETIPGRSGIVTISFWHAMGGPLGEVLNSMIEEFEHSYPTIKIHAVSMGDYGSLAQKLMSALWVCTPPTIAQMYESWTTQFYEANQLTPIESLLKADTTVDPRAFLNDFWPVLIENNTWDHQLITLPFNKSVPCYYYNLRRFDSLGITQFPATWNEFRSTAKHLTRRAAQLRDWVWGTAGGINTSLFVSMLLSHNGALLDEETGQPLFASPQAAEVLQFQVDLIYRDSAQIFSVGYSGQDDLLTGRIGMIYGTSVSRVFMKPKERFPIGMAPLPYWDKPAAIIQGTNIGLFRQTTPEQKAAAWQFIKWFTAPAQQARWGAATFYVPVRRSAINDSLFQTVLRTTPGWSECVEQMNYGVFEPKSRSWFEGRKVMESGLEPALRNILSPDDALARAAALMSPSRTGQGRIAFYVLSFAVALMIPMIAFFSWLRRNRIREL